MQKIKQELGNNYDDYRDNVLMGSYHIWFTGVTKSDFIADAHIGIVDMKDHIMIQLEVETPQRKNKKTLKFDTDETPERASNQAISFILGEFGVRY